MISLYKDLSFPKLSHRPYFISDFVSTIDGKVYVKKDGYWPIGSKTDYGVFTYLRAHADVIIDGKNTALRFAKPFFETLHSDTFQTLRKTLKKTTPIEYIVLSNTHDPSLQKALENPYKYPSTVFSDNLETLIQYLRAKNYSLAFVDGGPHVLASFMKEELLDELFLTISPKIFGSQTDTTVTLIEGHLFSPDSVPHAQLVSKASKEDEVFLRYKFDYELSSI